MRFEQDAGVSIFFYCFLRFCIRSLADFIFMKQFPFLSRTSFLALGVGLLVVFIVFVGVFVMPHIATRESGAETGLTMNTSASSDVAAAPTIDPPPAVNEVSTNESSATVANKPEQKPQPATDAKETVTTVATAPPVEKKTPLEPSTEVKKTPTPTESKKETYTAVLTVRSPNGTDHYSVDVDVGATVQDLMNGATSQGLSFKTKQFASLGTYVTTMNGVTEDKDAGLYWFYRVNEKKATSGITTKRLKKGDTVQWSYEKEF